MEEITTNKTLPFAPPEHLETTKEMLSMPSSQAVNLVRQALAAGKKPYESIEAATAFKEKLEKPARGKTEIRIKGKPQGESQMLIKAREGRIYAVTLSNINLLTGDSITAQNVLDGILYEMGQQRIDQKRELTSKELKIPYQKFIEYGVASRLNNVKKLIKDEDLIARLLSLQIASKEVQEGEKNNIVAAPLFARLGAVKEGLEVVPNSELNWDNVIQGFLSVPRYLFQLERNAKTLLLYICEQIRINGSGSFRLSLRSVIARLMLPSEKETKNPKRDIKDRIKEATEEINTLEKRQKGNNKELSLRLVVKEEASITEWLDTGYISVKASGRLTEVSSNIQAEQDRKIKAIQKRKERNEDKAFTEVAREELKKRLEQQKG